MDLANAIQLARQHEAKVVRLTRSKFAVVDVKDYPVVRQFNWRAHTKSGYTSAIRKWLTCESPPYPGATIALAVYLLGDPPETGMLVDHISGNSLDCRRANMRWATAAQNSANRRHNVRSRYQFKGVFQSGARRWGARIGRNGRKHLGVYDRQEDAARAYDRAAVATYGEFARTNVGLGLLIEDDGGSN